MDIRQFIKNNKLENHTDTEILQLFFNRMETKQVSSLAVAPTSGRTAKNLTSLLLGGLKFAVTKPITIRGLHGAIISNGAIEAAEGFPEGRYLLDVQEVNTLKIENVLLECNKRASGIFAHKFLRLRIEDCTILHQKDYGIYANEKGYNHELEIVKCNIVEYLWGDGTSRKDKAGFPDFRIAANRTSTGVYLGQADNVVADCNINLCRVGIKVGMRANRIQGNHITAGGSVENEIFEGIVLDKHIKSSCLIVNNYIDNCRIVLNVDNKPVNARNYVTVTDNLFYKGYNHPEDGREFNHIVVRALKPQSILQNVIIANNQFYNQDEHLGELTERRITPIHVERAWETTGKQDDLEPLNRQKLSGTIVSHNVFTNVSKYHETPMGSHATMVTELPEKPSDIFEADFSSHLVWGDIYSCNVTMICEDTESEPVAYYAVCSGKKVKVRTHQPVRARFSISVDINRPYGNDTAVVD